MNTDIARVVDDPSWLVHRYDPQYDAFHFRRATRRDHADATFLIDAYLKDSGSPPVIGRRAVRGALPVIPAPRHFLFHSAFCCSTLLARALDRPALATVLKEPVVLNDLVGWQRRGGAGPRFDAVLVDTLDALGRPFERDEAVIVKPSNVANAIAGALIAAQPHTHAILMHAPLDTFLTSVAKKGLEGRLWVRGLFAGLIQDGITDLGYDADALFGQTDLQIAALGWLAQHRVFHTLLAGPWRARMRSLRSDTLLADPVATIAAVGRLFDLPIDQAEAVAIGTGPAFVRHSKTGLSFNAQDRSAEYRAAGDMYADEIAKVAIWARQVADVNGIPLDLPAALIG